MKKLLKKSSSLIKLCTIFVLTSLTGLFAQTTNPTITIVNDTGYTVYNVYLSQTASDSWGTDKLSSDQVLLDGQSVTLQLPYALNVVNRYDIRLKDLDGDTYTKMDVLVSANSKIVFTMSDFDEKNTNATTTTSNLPSITIVNNTGYSIYHVYFSQTASDSWGTDKLASDQILRDGQSVTLQLPYALDVVNRYDIRLKDSDDDTYTKMNVLLTADMRIVFTMSDMD